MFTEFEKKYLELHDELQQIIEASNSGKKQYNGYSIYHAMNKVNDELEAMEREL